MESPTPDSIPRILIFYFPGISRLISDVPEGIFRCESEEIEKSSDFEPKTEEREGALVAHLYR